MESMMRTPGILAVTAVAIGLAACSSSSGPSVLSRSDIVGDWQLQTIDGKPLPYRFDERTFPNGIGYDDALAGTLHFVDNSPNSFWRGTIDPTSTVPNSCCQDAFTFETEIAWDLDGSDSLTITAIYPGGFVNHKAHVDGEQLTWQLTRGAFLPDGFYVYRKSP